MLTEWAVFSRRTPICSAMDMKRLLKTSSITGSTSVPTAARLGRGRTRVSSRCPSLARGRLPAGVDDRGRVGLGDDRRAGDGVAGPQVRAAVEAHVRARRPPTKAGPARRPRAAAAPSGSGRASCRSGWAAASSAGARSCSGARRYRSASTETASTTSGLSMVKA